MTLVGLQESTSRGCLTPLLQFVVQLVSAVDKILTDIASRGPSAVAELLVSFLSPCV